MAGESFKEYALRLVRQSGIVGKLIAINTVIFLFLLILMLIAKLFVVEEISLVVAKVFTAPSTFEGFLSQPWSFITYMFSHYEIIHFLMNMLVLYFIGRLFMHFLGEKRLLWTYLFGGFFGYFFHLICYEAVPLFEATVPFPTLGASGAINAIFVAIGFYKPRYKVNLFGIIPVPLIALALVFIFIDIGSIGSNDGTAHMVHLGGALFGGLSVINVDSPKNFMNRFLRWISNFKLPRLTFRKKTKFKVHEGGRAKGMTDEEYNYQKKKHQERVDAILEKISKKGYEGLTKEEKEILFHESKRKE